MEPTAQRTADHSSRSSLDFCAVIGAVIRGLELDDLGGLRAVLLGPQFDDYHQLAARPQVRVELVALVLGDAERTTQSNRRDAELMEGFDQVGSEVPVKANQPTR